MNCIIVPKPPLPRQNKNVFRKCFGGEREASVLFIRFIGVLRKEEMLTGREKQGAGTHKEGKPTKDGQSMHASCVRSLFGSGIEATVSNSDSYLGKNRIHG